MNRIHDKRGSMQIRYYVIFREVAATRNFTKAAERLFLTQSAVSHAIKELEEAAGTKLFERLHKSVRLTPSGERLLQEVTPILEEFERMESRIQHLEQEAPLRIASCITIAQAWLLPILQRFRRECPEVPVRVQVNRASEALELLKQRKVDAAFIEGNIAQGQFIAKQFSSYALWAVAAPGYCSPVCTLEQLLQETLLLRERGSAVREVFESAVTLAGYQASAQWVSVDSQPLIEAAKAGLGIAVLPEILVAPEIERGRLQKIEVSDLCLTNSLTIVVNRNQYQTRSLQRLWNMVETEGRIPYERK